MKIEVIDDGTVALVRTDGKLDSSNATEFEAALNQVLEGDIANLIIDLDHVSFMASAGLRVLLATTKKLTRNGGVLRVFGLNGLVRETFEISGFISIIDVRNSEIEAREGLS